MRNIKEIALFAFIAILFATCKKEEVPPSVVIGEPVFSFNGFINGNNVSLQAGVNNYYMYSSFAQDSVAPDSVVYSFIGNLQNISTNKNSIQISINDYKVSVKNASIAKHIDTSLSLPSYFYYEQGSGDTTGYRITFTPKIYSGSAEAFTYSFGDGTPNTTSTTSAPVTHTYKTETTYTTSLTVDFSSCGPVPLSNPINIGLGANSLIIDSITYTSKYDTSGRYRIVSLNAYIKGGAPPYTYVWNYGDGSPLYSVDSNSTTNSVSHQYDSIDTYLINLKVTDKNGTSSAYNAYVVDSLGTPVCRFDYFISEPIPVVVNNNYDLSGITIIYTDGSGKVYTSRNPLQPNTSNFSITSVSSYKNNLNNQATKELTVKFNCMLYNGSAGILANGTATIAVAYQ